MTPKLSNARVTLNRLLEYFQFYCSIEGELEVKGSRSWGLLATMLVALAAVAGAGCGSGGETTAETPATPAGKAEAAGFDGVHGGEVELVLQVKHFKKKPESVKMRVLGTFVKNEGEPLPQFDLAIESHGELAGHNIEFLSGPLVRKEKWVFNFDGKVYEPDHATFEELKSKFAAAEQEEGDPGNAMACVEAAEGFNVADVVHHVSFEGKSETLDAKKVETFGADLDLQAVIDEAIKLGKESPGCKTQLEAVGVPPAAQLEKLEKEVSGSLTASRLTLSLDKKGTVRYFNVLANFELPHNQELEVEVLMRLTRVNEVTEVPYAKGYSPWSALLGQFGLNESDLKQASAGEIYLGALGVLADRLFGREGS